MQILFGNVLYNGDNVIVGIRSNLQEHLTVIRRGLKLDNNVHLQRFGGKPALGGPPSTLPKKAATMVPSKPSQHNPKLSQQINVRLSI